MLIRSGRDDRGVSVDGAGVGSGGEVVVIGVSIQICGSAFSASRVRRWRASTASRRAM